MAQTAGQLTDTVLQRVFDAGAVATTRGQVRDLLSRSQQLVNSAFDSIVVIADFNTGPRQQVFSLADFAPDVLRLISVRDKKRDLSEVPFSRLAHISTHWFGQSGPRWENFARLGRTLIVVHPMMQSASLITLAYTQILPKLLSDADVCVLLDDQLPLLTKLVETLILLRQRNFTGVKTLVEDLMKEAKAIKMADGKTLHGIAA